MGADSADKDTKTLATAPEGLSLIPKSHIKNGENQLCKFCTYTHPEKETKRDKRRERERGKEGAREGGRDREKLYILLLS